VFVGANVSSYQLRRCRSLRAEYWVYTVSENLIIIFIHYTTVEIKKETDRDKNMEKKNMNYGQDATKTSPSF